MVKKVLYGQGIPLKDKIIHQDNQSLIVLTTKDYTSLGKRSWVMDVQYFEMKDCAERGELHLCHISRNGMIPDFNTKPLQGSKFREFKDFILGTIAVGSCCGK